MYASSAQNLLNMDILFNSHVFQITEDGLLIRPKNAGTMHNNKTMVDL